MVANAPSLMHDAGGALTVQVLISLNNAILLEVEKLRKRRVAADTATFGGSAEPC